MTRRLGWAVLALLAVLVAYPAFLIARAKSFPKRYQVQSIALVLQGATEEIAPREWRSLKYEGVQLRAYEDLRTARSGIGRYVRFTRLPDAHGRLHRLRGRAEHEGAA